MLSATPPVAEPAYDPFNTGGDADADEGGLPSILVIIHFSYIVHLDVQSSRPIPPGLTKKRRYSETGVERSHI